MSPNSNNSHNSQSSPPSDVCLLLRAHAESRWLSHQVVPVLREIEQRESLPDEQLGAALAYLEVLWIEACGRARETESARVELDAPGASGDQALTEKARRYDTAVRRLRDAIARRVSLLLSVPAETAACEGISERRIIDRPANS
jgi:hypothetical protein